jgi:hypothetical protein
MLDVEVLKMSRITYVQYEGSDEQIRDLVSKLIPTPDAASATTVRPTIGHNGPGTWDLIAEKFERSLSATAANGKPGQKRAVEAWLRVGGSIELTKLWKAAGVKNQHDYAGVGGSLTKNMLKAGGPREWYLWQKQNSGDWIYSILPELVDPLKRALGIA